MKIVWLLVVLCKAALGLARWEKGFTSSMILWSIYNMCWYYTSQIHVACVSSAFVYCRKRFNPIYIWLLFCTLYLLMLKHHHTAKNMIRIMNCFSFCQDKKCVKKETCSRKSSRVSYAIPLEIIYTTPLQTWNPFRLQFHNGNNFTKLITRRHQGRNVSQYPWELCAQTQRGHGPQQSILCREEHWKKNIIWFISCWTRVQDFYGWYSLCFELQLLQYDTIKMVLSHGSRIIALVMINAVLLLIWITDRQTPVKTAVKRGSKRNGVLTPERAYYGISEQYYHITPFEFYGTWYHPSLSINMWSELCTFILIPLKTMHVTATILIYCSVPFMWCHFSVISIVLVYNAPSILLIDMY